ncbi:MAG TPA: CerR family C-terminal domain-containing protein [Planctomycetota bacterium]|nr:CerR family C-terminal domain-containing protein [Planctomycetota bacterium]
MRRKRIDGQETRLRLLEAAGALFARKGFWEASLAEIGRDAKANIAAANYHFSSKEELYVAAWRHAHEKMLVLYPPDGGVPASAPAAERLRGRIHAILRRMFDPRGHDLAMIHKEIAFPTGLLSAALHETVRPLRQAFLQIVRELAGPHASEQQVTLCHLSVVTQCFGFRMHERQSRSAEDTGGPSGRKNVQAAPADVSPEYIAAIAEHVTSFSLAGILRLRRAAGTGSARAAQRRLKRRSSRRESQS